MDGPRRAERGPPILGKHFKVEVREFSRPSSEGCLCFVPVDAPYAADPGMAASPDWRTWFPAPAWLPKDPEAACEVAARHLRASGLEVGGPPRGSYLRAVSRPAAILVEFRVHREAGLRLRYRPTPARTFGRWRWMASVAATFAGAHESGLRWALALRVDRILRARSTAT